jgi:hypothetical protein
MKPRRLLLFLTLVLVVIFSTPRRVQSAASLWKSIAPGIDYREFYLPYPNHLYVARMDRENPQVFLETSIGQGRLREGAETVSGMAARYDQAINYWGQTWGGRNQVVATINGFFFDTETGTPWQGQIQSGWYAKRFDDFQTGSGIAWTLDRSLFIGGCVVHPPAKQFLTILQSGERQAFDGINTARGDDELVIYTPQYDRSTGTSADGVEALVELDSPLLILPEPALITGTVRAVREGLGDSPLPFDHIVLSASGQAGANLRAALRTGDRIGISQELKQYEPDCRTPASGGWEKTYAGIGGSFVFLRDGLIQGFDDLGALLRSPRTVVAYNDRYIYFIVVDGRDRFQSVGMSIVEMAVFAKTRLGAVWGVALDGGGSSTIVVNGEVKNKPNIELAAQEGGGDPNQRPITERVVGNGLMMVVVQPGEYSSAFYPGDRVLAASDLEVRLGPGTNYAALVSLPASTEGIVVEHANRLNGVLAKGSFWWMVAFGDIAGWVPEEALVLIGER